MDLEQTRFNGLYIIKPKNIKDRRGSFIKIYNSDNFLNYDLDFKLKENYYTVSQRNVIRGMHFQAPPYDHKKIVYVPQGKVIDVVLDIRKGSKTYGEYLSYELSSENGIGIFIPKGFAHGFKSIKNNTIVTYLQSTCYNPESDKGIRYDSFGFNWECERPIISERDNNFKKFNEFISPFI